MQNLLQNIVHGQLLIGFILVFICPPYVPTLVRLALGPKWAATSAPIVLQAYCRFIPLLGINGITEAFVQAVASQKQVSRLSRFMWLWTAIYIGACYLFVAAVGLHETGLIYANMVNMSCRIAYSLQFTWNYFGGLRLARFRPSLATMLLLPLIGLFGSTLASDKVESRRADFKVLAKGGVLGIASLLVMSAANSSRSNSTLML